MSVYIYKSLSVLLKANKLPSATWNVKNTHFLSFVATESFHFSLENSSLRIDVANVFLVEGLNGVNRLATKGEKYN